MERMGKNPEVQPITESWDLPLGPEKNHEKQQLIHI
jgi:hypothetical protein